MGHPSADRTAMVSNLRPPFRFPRFTVPLPSASRRVRNASVDDVVRTTTSSVVINSNAATPIGPSVLSTRRKGPEGTLGSIAETPDDENRMGFYMHDEPVDIPTSSTPAVASSTKTKPLLPKLLPPVLATIRGKELVVCYSPVQAIRKHGDLGDRSSFSPQSSLDLFDAAQQMTTTSLPEFMPSSLHSESALSFHSDATLTVSTTSDYITTDSLSARDFARLVKLSDWTRKLPGRPQQKAESTLAPSLHSASATVSPTSLTGMDWDVSTPVDSPQITPVFFADKGCSKGDCNCDEDLHYSSFGRSSFCATSTAASILDPDFFKPPPADLVSRRSSVSSTSSPTQVQTRPPFIIIQQPTPTPTTPTSPVDMPFTDRPFHGPHQLLSPTYEPPFQRRSSTPSSTSSMPECWDSAYCSSAATSPRTSICTLGMDVIHPAKTGEVYVDRDPPASAAVKISTRKVGRFTVVQETWS
ncbi:hypothetical protein BC829DRAFT_301322 [Chytridium lagenaria]|nr:hypothetical protein BC829DRAFT_301322 [Chytridium lagenaria]